MSPLHILAAPAEGERVLAARGLRAVCVGVGKGAAAAGVCAAVAEARPRSVVLFGVCGAYPAEHLAEGGALAVGDLCVVSEQVLADEGVEHERGFSALDELGLGEIGPWSSDPRLVSRVAARWPGGAPVVVRCATVSTCSGTDARSAQIAARSRAQIETMESAAVALACARLGLPLVEVRCVSNLTGDRQRAEFDPSGACARVQECVLALGAAGAFDA